MLDIIILNLDLVGEKIWVAIYDRRMLMEVYKMYINGQWLESTHGVVEVLNPATGEFVGTVPNGGVVDCQEAINSAAEAFQLWSRRSAYERSSYLYRFYELLMAHAEAIAEVMTKEQGKPLKESIGEIRYAASYVLWYAEEGKRIDQRIIPHTSTGGRIQVLKEPVGVVGVITPWNFPAAMMIRKIAPALAAGCTIVAKPPRQTPITAVKIFELLEMAQLPQGVCNLVTGDARSIGSAMMKDARVRKVSFTGSTEVGKSLMAQSAATMKKVSLELGGHAPLIVFDDADLDKAVKGTMASKFRNGGQVCIATNRVYVHETVVDEFVERLTAAVVKLNVGDGMTDGIDIGPIIDRPGFEKIKSHVADACEKGASILVGGTGRHMIENVDAGYYHDPTILLGVNHDMLVMNEETFGPIVPIMTFKTEDEVLAYANDTPFGLASYCFTESLSRSIRVQESLSYGMVGINTGSISMAQAPFGGIKDSGIGREGGQAGIEEYLNTKYVCIGGLED